MSSFQRIGIYARPRTDNPEIAHSVESLRVFLLEQGVDVFFEQATAEHFPCHGTRIAHTDQNHQGCDLFIVVGGDGTLLSAAHHVVEQGIPVLGINRGHLGFLTDILPSEIENQVGQVLSGKYHEERRTLLSVHFTKTDGTLYQNDALNDIVLSHGNIIHMIHFTIEINGEQVCTQRGDGLIVATPTGSTAYALSGGGPILHPNLNAFVLVPMFPHTLSARPLVVDDRSTIKITLGDNPRIHPSLSCDGQTCVEMPENTELFIKKKSRSLRLIHPSDYNYYETLRSKLRWNAQPC